MVTRLQILLVGEQPAPNLLPMRHLNPDKAVLVHTQQTLGIAENLRRLLEPICPCSLIAVDAYEVGKIVDAIRTFLAGTAAEDDLVFNLTGGTKPMALAAFLVAQERGSRCVYYQTDGGRSLLAFYEFQNGRLVSRGARELPASISLDDYLRMYVGEYATGHPRNDLECAVVEVLRDTPRIDEMFASVRPRGLAALEVDFLVRCGNQVGVGEVKTRGDKAAIDQLNAVAEQRYLGTYVRKFLVTGNAMDVNNRELASAYRIRVIELSSPRPPLGERDRAHLASVILSDLGASGH